MVVCYDQTRKGGLDVVFHIVGSSLYSMRTLIPASLSCALTAVVANVPDVAAWFQPRVLESAAFFNALRWVFCFIPPGVDMI